MSEKQSHTMIDENLRMLSIDRHKQMLAKIRNAVFRFQKQNGEEFKVGWLYPLTLNMAFDEDADDIQYVHVKLHFAVTPVPNKKLRHPFRVMIDYKDVTVYKDKDAFLDAIAEMRDDTEAHFYGNIFKEKSNNNAKNVESKSKTDDRHSKQ